MVVTPSPSFKFLHLFLLALKNALSIILRGNSLFSVSKHSILDQSILCLGSPKRRWEGSIELNLEEIGINAGNWVDSSQNRDYWGTLVNAALNLQVP